MIVFFFKQNINLTLVSRLKLCSPEVVRNSCLAPHKLTFVKAVTFEISLKTLIHFAMIKHFCHAFFQLLEHPLSFASLHCLVRCLKALLLLLSGKLFTGTINLSNIYELSAVFSETYFKGANLQTNIFPRYMGY